ncbi:DUF2313 domain-containing protein [Acinetobacter piscicola]|uniref:DUF2313 domain-containing protein n=1 Tax=Acinetobacter piscicola TaxID=2006115 RepID=UPI0010229443|nr:DUF2313 domain-containing protein [Acinetobacter piscicola]RYL25152.1 DUF2313 domain-containing protein [Acinetobacter piscicola]
MTLEETTQLYATVLRQLLPAGGYDTSSNTMIAKDIYAHAKALAQCDLDAKRLLSVLEGIPPELLNEYEKEYGLPLKCTTNVATSYAERIAIIQWVKNTKNVFNRNYLDQLLGIFGVTVVELVKFVPFRCTQACNQPLNTEQLRYKVTLKLQQPVQADMACIIKHYLPAFLRFDIVEV